MISSTEYARVWISTSLDSMLIGTEGRATGDHGWVGLAVLVPLAVLIATIVWPSPSPPSRTYTIRPKEVAASQLSNSRFLTPTPTDQVRQHDMDGRPSYMMKAAIRL
ncbi:hypothetical protein ACIGO9_30280 [Nocardia asteroides]|uniref:hypothetical protein n=1 Tax=Nocardia asteroides TaxID=1824 RepID=UPI0037C88BCB